MPKPPSGKERRELAKKKKQESYSKALALCNAANKRVIAELQDKHVIKAIQQISNSKVVKGRSYHVDNCPALLNEPGLPQGAADHAIRNFEARFTEQDLVLF